MENNCMIFLTLTSLVIIMAGASIPDLSWDHYTEDVVTISPFVQYIYDIRYNNEDKPDHCRNDLCEEETELLTRRGPFIWQKTTLGFRHYVRCPYDVIGGKYGYRDCSYSNGTDPTSKAAWMNSVTEHCQEPPLTEVLKSLKKQLAKNETKEESWWQNSFASILDTVREYPDYPIFDDNIQDTFNLIYKVVSRAVSDDLAPHTSTVDVMFRCLDWVVYTDVKQPSLSYYDKPKVMWLFTVLSEMVQLPPGEQEMIFPGNLATIHIQLSSDFLLKNKEFEARYPDTSNPMKTNVSIEFSDEDLKLVRIMYMAIPNYHPYYITFFDNLRLMSIDPDDGEYGMEFVTEIELWGYNHIGPVLYVSISHNPDETWSKDLWMSKFESADRFTVMYSMMGDRDSEMDDTGESLRCGHTDPRLNITDYGVGEEWYANQCEEIFDEFGTMTCYCNVSGYLSVLNEEGMTSIYHDGGMGNDDDFYQYPERDISVFMGFPFSYELYVASHILRAISLVCLVATLVSFLVYRKTRRGTPTKILLNLCVSLIVLLVSLYITEVIAGSRIGCRISNVLRYYLILVSLMWNGVEATNMYLMLVKVFNHDIHRFILKAGLVAWGVPLVLVGCVLAYSVKGFDGIYLDSCEFRCQLREPVLYYFFLLPMGVIIAFNLIIFAMVLKVIIQSSSIPSSKERRTNHCMRLCGALSTMVLLGVPWIFSAFGAIDASDSNFTMQTMEGVFHVVFVVFVNLQGVFIFAFHCARNAEVRQQWRSTFSATGSTIVSKSRASTSHDPGTSHTSEKLSNTKL